MSKSANPGLRVMRRSLHVLPLILFVAACAGPDARQAGTAGSPVGNQLIAEIALQRGEYLVAVQEYVRLAEKSADPEQARRATELAFEFNYDTYALQAAERWVALAPDEQLAHAYLGRMYLRSNQPDLAFASIDRSLGNPADRTDRDYLSLGAELGTNVSAGRALAVFRRFAEQAPDNPGVKAGIAALAGEAGRYDEAIEAARETVQIAPDWVMARVWLAEFLLSAGERAAAFDQMAYALEISPGPDMELEFIQLLARAGEEREARERMERLVARYPDDPNLVRARAALSMRVGDLDAAQRDYVFLLSEAYYVNEAFWHIGDISMRREQYGVAIRYFNRVGGGDWLLPARNSLSQAYLELGDGATALAVQRELAADYPKQALATLPSQAEILVAMDRLPEALAAMDEALNYRPWDERLWLFRGGLEEQGGMSEEAVMSFRQALTLAPDSAVVKNALGYTLLNTENRDTDDFEEAAELIRAALEIEPSNPAYMDSLGWAYYRLGNLPEALKWLQKAYEQMRDAEIAAHLGEVLWETGQRDIARAIWSDAVTREPDNPILLDTIRRYTS